MENSSVVPVPLPTPSLAITKLPELWKKVPLPHLSERYYISNHGRVFSLYSKDLMSLSFSYGYLKVNLQ